MARKIQLEIVGESRDAERAFKKAGNAADKFSRKLKGLSKKTRFGGLKGAIKGAGISGALGAGGLVGAAAFGGVSAAKAAAGFEKTMARVQGLAGQSQKQVRAWSSELLSLGPTLGKTPQELAEALYFVASSGVPAAKAIDVVTASAKAAAAGLGETEVVADAVTSVMNAYAATGMGAAKATDVLVATVREGKGEADQFAGVIGNVAAFASRLNVPFEQVGAALAAMTQLGTDPRTAATQLMAFFSQVMKVSGPMQKKADKLGFSYSDLTDILASGDLRGALQMVKREMGESAEGLAALFPNVRAFRATLALTGKDGGKVAGIFDRMGKSTGSLGKAWEVTQKTADHNMMKLKASVETLKIAFGQGLLPMITKVSSALATKLADPAFVARVRQLGILVGTTLYNAFAAIGAWFQANWPAIQGGFRTFANIMRGAVKIGGQLKSVLLTITYPLRMQLKILLAIWDKVLGAISTGAGILSHLPGVGGTFKGIQGAVDATRAGLKNPLGPGAPAPGAPRRGKRPMIGGGFTPGRASGGWVIPGQGYRVTDRETFVPSAPGRVMNGGGGFSIGVVNLYGVQTPQQMLRELERIANTGAASRRGRFGGANLALG